MGLNQRPRCAAMSVAEALLTCGVHFSKIGVQALPYLLVAKVD